MSLKASFESGIMNHYQKMFTLGQIFEQRSL